VYHPIATHLPNFLDTLSDYYSYPDFVIESGSVATPGVSRRQLLLEQSERLIPSLTDLYGKDFFSYITRQDQASAAQRSSLIDGFFGTISDICALFNTVADTASACYSPGPIYIGTSWSSLYVGLGDCSKMDKKSKKTTTKKQTIAKKSSAKRNPANPPVRRQLSTTAGLSGIHTAPAAISRTVGNLNPRIRQLPNGDCRITHREYITDLFCDTAFTVGHTSNGSWPLGLLVNPGNAKMFKWLSKIAMNYESYVFEDLAFSYTGNVGTGTAGTIMMLLDVDVSDPQPLDKTELLNNRDASRTNAWSEGVLVIPREDLHKRKTYTVDPSNTVSLLLNSRDPGLAATGTFYPATIAGPGTVTGELYVSYTVRLMTPHYTPLAYGNTAQTITATAGLTATNLFGPTWTTISGPLTMGQSISIATTGVITFNIAGLYSFSARIGGTALVAPVVNNVTGGAAVYFPSATTDSGSDVNAAAVLGTYFALINVTTLPATFYPVLTGAATVTQTYWNLALIAYPQ
jgi:hypothetical protein